MAWEQEMKKTDFDEFADDYESLLASQLGFFDRDAGYFAEYKVRVTRALLPEPPRSILDFGCGIGRSIPFLRASFPDSALKRFRPLGGEPVRGAAASRVRRVL